MTVERFGLVETLEAAVEPSLCELQTLAGILIVAFTGRTLVECHHDVGSDNALSVHHALRCEYMLRAVDV